MIGIDYAWELWEIPMSMLYIYIEKLLHVVEKLSIFDNAWEVCMSNLFIYIEKMIYVEKLRRDDWAEITLQLVH